MCLTCWWQPHIGNILPLLIKMFYFNTQLTNDVAPNPKTKQPSPQQNKTKHPQKLFLKWLSNSVYFLDSWIKYYNKENVVFPSLREMRWVNKLKYVKVSQSSIFIPLSFPSFFSLWLLSFFSDLLIIYSTRIICFLKFIFSSHFHSDSTHFGTSV